MVLIKKCQTKLINFMAMTRILATIACLIIAFNQAGSMSGNKEKYQIVEKDGYNLVIHPDAPVLGYSPDSGVGIIMVDGLPFKDLNRNGKLEPYEDWRLPAEERATDLASRLTVEQIAGLMLYSSHQPVPNTARPVYGGKPFAESGAMPWSLTDEQKAFLLNDNLRAVLVTKVENPEVAARWSNRVQAFVEGLGLGIPANNSSDPLNETATADEFLAGAGGQISLWPRPVGMGAIMDPDLVKRFGEIASREYRALGITTALSPQVDLATEPRWRRVLGCFSEDPQLVTDYARAYCDGFQTSQGDAEIEGGWGYHSVNAMVKHWPGGGSEEGGRDSHYCFGKFAVYPGGQFETRLLPFTRGAFRLDGPTGSASAVMPFYTVPWGIDPGGDNVAMNYSRYIITELLREKYGFDGVACTDWVVTGDYEAVDKHWGKPWGVEHLSVAERHYRVLLAGVDQFGGNQDKQPIVEAYGMWVRDYGEQSARERFEQSARRLLLNSFRLGLFENPYVNPDEASRIVGNPEYMQAGYEAQLRSIVMAKNHGNCLPVQSGLRVYLPKRHYPARKGFWGEKYEESTDYPIRRELVEQYFTVVDDPDLADFAIVDIDEPLGGYGYSRDDVETGGNGYMPISLQYRPYTATTARQPSIAGGDPKESFVDRSYRSKTIETINEGDLDLVLETRHLMGDKPVVVTLNLNRPAVVAEFEGVADAILLCFGVQNKAKLDIIAGRFEPQGLLPFQMPADMQTVEAQNEDEPHDMTPYRDMDGHVYDFAYGLNWSGIITDHRTARYRK